jgi:protein O-mannosyl-transferase
MPNRTPKSGAGARVKPEAPKPGFFHLSLTAPVALVLLTVLIYARSLGTPIHDWDDNIYFFRDSRVEHLSAESVQRILTQPFFSNYHPLTTLTIALDRAAWGTWVPGFHLTQLFFYAGGVLGIYFLFVRILRRRAEAFVAAAIYAAHAVHVESVAWLASRKDVVCLFFYVFALLAYVRYTAAASHRWRPYVLSFLLSGAAMLSKGYAVILPALFVAYDLCFAPRITRRQLLDKVPFVALTAAMTLLTVYAQDKQSGLVDLALSVAQRILRLGEVLALYAGHTLPSTRPGSRRRRSISPWRGSPWRRRWSRDSSPGAASCRLQRSGSRSLRSRSRR